jgi:hypothetical protein
VEDPNCYDRRSEKDKQKYGHKLVVRRDFPVLTPLASSSTTTDGCLVGILLPVIILMCYLHYACSALSNLKAQFCVGTMLVSTSGLAGNSTIAGGSCRNPKVGGKKKQLIEGTSHKQ